MADEFDREMLTGIMDRLADKLDTTAGDQNTAKELAGMRATLREFARKYERNESSSSQRASASRTVREFFQEWDKHRPMQEIRDLLRNGNTNRGGNGIGGGAPRRGTILHDLSQKDAQRARDEATKDSKKLSWSAKMASRGLEGFTKGLNGSLSGLTASIGVEAGIIQQIVSGMDRDLDSYRIVAQSAEGSITSIQALKDAAHGAYMSTETLAKAMKEGTNGARMLGAVGFARLTIGVRNATKATGMMAMTLEEQRAAAQDYLEIERRRGTLLSADSNSLVSGVQALVMSSQSMASVLGKTQEDARKAKLEIAQDTNVQTMIAALGLDANQTGNAMTMASELSPAARKYLEDKLAFGQAVREDAATYQAVDPAMTAVLDRMAADLKSRTYTDARTARDVRSASAANASDPSRRLAYLQLGMAGSGPGAEAVSSSLQSTIAGASFRDPTTAALTPTDPATVGLLGFEDSLSRLKGQFTKLGDEILRPLMASMGKWFKDLMAWSDQLTGRTSEFISGMNLNFVQGATAVVGGLIASAVVSKGIMSIAGGLLSKLLPGSLGRLFGAASGRGILGGLLGGARGAAGAAGAARVGATGLGLAGAGTALAVGGAAVGGVAGMAMGYGHIRNNKDESLLGGEQGEGGFLSSRASGYLGSTASGAIAGALIGSVVPVIGTAVGALVGGGIGLASSLWADREGVGRAFSGNQSRPSAVVRPRGAAAPIDARSRAAGDYSTGAPRNQLSLDQAANRMVELHTAGNSSLKKLVEQSSKQIELLKEELVSNKNYYEATIRMQEAMLRTIRSGSGAVN